MAKKLSVTHPIEMNIAIAIECLYCHACEKRWLVAKSVKVTGDSAMVRSYCKHCEHEVTALYNIELLRY